MSVEFGAGEALLEQLVFPRKVNVAATVSSGSVIAFFASQLRDAPSITPSLLDNGKWNQLRNVFQNWQQLQSDSELNVDNLQRHLNALTQPGDYLPIFCQEKNALLCLRVPLQSEKSGQFLVSATQVQLPAETFYSREPHELYPIRTFPDGPTFFTEKSKVESFSCAEKIVELANYHLKGSTSSNFKKGEKDLLGICDPSYVTNWMLSFLGAANEVFKEVTFHSKVRDKVLVAQASDHSVPWRRSAELFCVNYVLRHFLTWHLGSVKGTVAYKAIMLHVFTKLLEGEMKKLDVEMGVQMMAKIARRMEKLDSLLELKKEELPPDVSGEVENIKRNGAEAVTSTRSQLDEEWKSIQNSEKEKMRADISALQQFGDLLPDTLHDLNDLELFSEQAFATLKAKQVILKLKCLSI